MYSKLGFLGVITCHTKPCSMTCPRFDLHIADRPLLDKTKWVLRLNRSAFMTHMFIYWFFLWSLQEPSKSVKSSTKNSNAGGGKDAGTDNSEEVKMIDRSKIKPLLLIMCLTVEDVFAQIFACFSWAFSFTFSLKFNFIDYV